MKREKFVIIDEDKDIATMSYMAHELRMTKAYLRKVMEDIVFVSNFLWIVGAILSLVVR